jgi:hypothetical protein
VKVDGDNQRDAVWLDHVPGNVAAYDQVKSMAIDAVRESRYAVVLCQDADGENALIGVADGVVGDAASFFVDSAVALFNLVVTATGLTAGQLCAHVLTHLPTPDGDGK